MSCALLYCWSLNFAIAQPDFSSGHQLEGLTLYADAIDPDRFYYGPGDLQLAVDPSGMPDLKMVSMRYTGTEAAGDKGTIRFRNLLRFRVSMEAPSTNRLQRTKRKLQARGAEVTLSPLPIQRMQAHVVYTMIGANESAVNLSEKPGNGQFEADTPNGFNAEQAYWTERVFTLRLDDETAQAFVQALKDDQLLLSVSYAFYAAGVSEPLPALTFSGDPDLVASLQETFAPLADSSVQNQRIESRLIKADAFEVKADLNRWPELISSLDINDRIPPGYGALEIYCYDFNNALRPELYARRVEVEATAVGGRKVRVKATFKRNQPDLFVQTLRFDHVLRLDKPYKYRLTDITNEGERIRSVWKTRYSWSEILDVTTKILP